MASARTPPSTLLSALILLILVYSSSSESFSSVLTSDEILGEDQYLSAGNYRFKMQRDCDLVLYKNNGPIWASNTAGNGTKCYLALAYNGELFIYSDTKYPVWRSETSGDYGRYALVLQRNGNVIVFANPIWSTGTSNLNNTFNSVPPKLP